MPRTDTWLIKFTRDVQAVTAALTGHGHAASPAEVAEAFVGGAAVRGPEVAEILATLEALGQVRGVGAGRFVGA